MPEEPFVFISYAHEDAAYVGRLVTHLQAQGVTTWHDRELADGSRWLRVLQHRIEQCAVFILVESAHAQDSGWVEDEILYARKRNRPQLVLLLDGEPRFGADTLQPTDVTDGSMPGPAFLDRLRGLLSGETAARNSATLDGSWVVPPVPADIVARPVQAEALAAALTHGTGPVGVTGVYGGGGFGKTMLARMVVARDDVRAAFPGGLLWIEVGQERRDAQLTALIAQVCRQVGGTATDMSSPVAAGRTLAGLLAARAPMLVVLDDVWFADQIAPFLDFDAGAARFLLTTRKAGLLPLDATAVRLDQLDQEQARAVLTRGLDDLDPTVVARLLTLTGGWALAVKAANAALRVAVRDHRPLAATATWLAEHLAAEGPDVLDLGQEGSRDKTIGATMAASLHLLSDSDRVRYLELGIFAEDTPIDLSTLALLWGTTGGLGLKQTRRLAAALAEQSLVSDFDPVAGTLRLHDVIRAYLREQLSTTNTTAAHTALLEAAVAHHGISTVDGVRGWWELPASADYLWRHLATHLAGAGLVGELRALVTDLRWVEAKILHLGVAEVDADLAYVEGDPVAGAMSRELQQEGYLLGPVQPAHSQADILAARMGTNPSLAEAVARYTTTLPSVVRLRPGAPLPDAPHPALLRTLTGHTSRVSALALGRVGGRDIIVSASDDATVRLWDAATGTPIGPPLTGHTHWVTAVALGRVGDRDIIASASRDATVRLWDPAAAGPIGPPLTGHTNEVTAVALTRVGDRDIIVSGGSDAMVRLWDAAAAGPLDPPLAGHAGVVWAVAVGRIGDRDIIVSASSDTMVRRWDATTATSLAPPLAGHTNWVAAVAVGRAGDRDIIVSASDDRTVRIWDAVTAVPLGPPLAGHTGGVTAVAVGRVGDRDIIVSGSTDATVRIWDAVTAVPLGPPLAGHTGGVTAAVVGRVGDRDIIVSASTDATVRIWDAATAVPLAPPLTGHTGAVWAVAVGRVGDRDIIVSGSRDASVRRWDAATATPIGAPLIGHTRGVTAVAVGRVGDRDIIVSGSRDHTVRRWDAATATPVGPPLIGHTGLVWAVAVGRVGDRDIIVSGGHDQTVRRWDAATATLLGQSFTGHVGGVTAVAVSRVGDRDIIVSGGHDTTVRMWDAASATPIGQPLTGHTGWVTAVALGRVGDSDSIVSASHDRTVRLWDAATATLIHPPLTGHNSMVNAVTVGRVGHRDIIISAGSDGTVRVWDAATGAELATMRVTGPIMAIALDPTQRAIYAVGQAPRPYRFDLIGL